MTNPTSVSPDKFKEVQFQGDTLLAVNDLDKTYVAVRWVAEALGLTAGQIKSERKKIQEDLVLSQGERNFVLPTNGGMQPVVCLDIEFLPLWLAKISITPTMKRTRPQLVDKLVAYQLKAKDVLASAFIRPKTSAEMILAQAEVLVQQERRLAQIEQMQQQQMAATQQLISIMSEEPTRARITNKVKQLAQHRNTSVREAWHEVYHFFRLNYSIDLRRRAQNKRNKINQERMASGRPSYAEQTLKTMVKPIDIVFDNNMEKELLEIVNGRLMVGGPKG